MRWKCSPVVPITNHAAYGCVVVLLEPDCSINRNETVKYLVALSQLSKFQKLNRIRDTNGTNLYCSHWKCPVCCY